MAEHNSPPRSRNNDVPSYVTFFNRSDRTVNLFWINYEGRLVRYGLLPPFKGTSMNTYVTHPWIVRDAETGYPLLLNGKSVFHPSADTHEESRALIWIHIPVFSLLRRALEIIFIHFDPETVQKWDMPATLKDLLKTLSPITNFGNYQFFKNVTYYDLQQLGFEADLEEDEAGADDGDNDDLDNEDDNSEDDDDDDSDHLDDSDNEAVDNGDPNNNNNDNVDHNQNHNNNEENDHDHNDDG